KKNSQKNPIVSIDNYTKKRYYGRRHMRREREPRRADLTKCSKAAASGRMGKRAVRIGGQSAARSQ
ncbi:MAG: hypothetical protein IJ649_04305, partial [Oscillospiraceae bacterium]|nr:hypothetical protein [Oscillospiraceae bacterium]